MAGKKNSTPDYITKVIFKKEINRLDAKIDEATNRLDAKIDAVEKRLDAKIDAAVQSMKDYTDSRFNQLELRMDNLEARMDKLEARMDRMEGKLDRVIEKLDSSVRGLVDLIERSIGNQLELRQQLENHEKRIVKLEERTPS